MAMSSKCYRFNDITLDVDRRRVTRGSITLRLGKLTYELLLILAEAAPRVVTQEELVERLWGGRFVSPETVKQRVKLLRQALSDEADHPRYIRVVRGQGYRLIPDVEPLTGESPLPVWKRPAFVAASLAVIGLAVIIGIYRSYPDSLDTTDVNVLPNSVAVLLCDNLSPDPDDAYFAASIHEEILNQLVKIRSLNVIARTSVLQYADAPPPISRIAEELHVETVMECSVRYAGDAIVVTAQLIDPETNANLWTGIYPGDTSDLSTIFAMQADIAVNIANSLMAELSLEEQASIEKAPTESYTAYNFYLKSLTVPEGPNRTRLLLEYLDGAIRLDPEFALARARRALAYASPLTGNVPGQQAEYELRAETDARQALDLDSTLGEAHAALALIHSAHWRWNEAEQAFADVLRWDPYNVDVMNEYSTLNFYRGAYDKAVRLSRRGVQLDPLNLASHFYLGISYRYLRDYNAAAESFRNCLVLDSSLGQVHAHIGFTEISRGNFDNALSELRIAERIYSESVESAFRYPQLANAYAQMGRLRGNVNG